MRRSIAPIILPEMSLSVTELMETSPLLFLFLYLPRFLNAFTEAVQTKISMAAREHLLEGKIGGCDNECARDCEWLGNMGPTEATPAL